MNSRMLITGLGEFGLIKRFRRRIKTDPSVIVGSGDDCAVLRFDRDNYQLFTCDTIVERVDFTLKDPAYLIGRKSIAVAVSDIASCAGLPRHCLVALGLPKETPLKLIDNIFKGMLDISRRFKINIAGGDISSAREIVISVSMLGVVEKKYLCLRQGAKPKDIIFTSGSLGGSGRGKHLKFIPRVKEARALVKNFKINSMIDISDGLCADLGHILEESRVGALLYEGLIPLSKEASGLSDALYTGEDFELLFTVSLKEAKRLLKSKFSRLFKPIGEIVTKDQGFTLINKKNRQVKIKAEGFRHF
ncbi:MAG: thiamine-phosphate kinase [Candidatus Omnitrophota bacterium]